jgi:hypothetical protein
VRTRRTPVAALGTLRIAGTLPRERAESRRSHTPVVFVGPLLRAAGDSPLPPASSFTRGGTVPQVPIPERHRCFSTRLRA